MYIAVIINYEYFKYNFIKFSGIEVGDTKLVFTVTGDDDDINSAPLDLQVFYPLKIFPRNGTILIGTVFQLSIKGGPHPDTNVVFTATSPKVIRKFKRAASNLCMFSTF